MTMKESYADAVDWLSKHDSNKILIRVKSEKELKAYQNFFQEEMSNDLFLDSNAYERIEWKLDTTLDK